MEPLQLVAVAVGEPQRGLECCVVRARRRSRPGRGVRDGLRLGARRAVPKGFEGRQDSL